MLVFSVVLSPIVDQLICGRIKEHINKRSCTCGVSWRLSDVWDNLFTSAHCKKRLAKSYVTVLFFAIHCSSVNLSSENNKGIMQFGNGSMDFRTVFVTWRTLVWFFLPENRGFKLLKLGFLPHIFFIHGSICFIFQVLISHIGQFCLFSLIVSTKNL